MHTMLTLETPGRVHSLRDLDGHEHTFELTHKKAFLLNGRPATIVDCSQERQQIHVATQDQSYCFEAQAFWHAFAGTGPTPADAGLLLARSLALYMQIQHFEPILAHLKELEQTLSATLTSVTMPLPSHRLDPLAMQALEAYDGTPQTTQLLARILQQDTATVERWAKLLGKHRSAPLAVESDHAQKLVEPQKAAPSDACSNEPQNEKPNGKRFRWTTDQEQQLTDAFNASSGPNVTAIIQEIAQRYHWPAHAVQYKLYELQLPQRKQQQQAHQREGQQQRTQEDHPSGGNSSPEVHHSTNGATDASGPGPSASQL